MLELEDIPGRNLKPSIRTLFGKIIHFNCPLKLCNNFISLREPIYFSKQRNIEIFEITDNNLKIYRSSGNFEVDIYGNTLNIRNFRDASHSQHPWTARHWYIMLLTEFQ